MARVVETICIAIRNRRTGPLLRFRFPHIWLGIGLLLVALLIGASFMPNFSPAIYFEGIDKVGHFVAYLAVTCWFSLLFTRGRDRWVVALGLVVLGAGLEYLQRFSASHVFEYADIGANAAGVLCALLLAQTRFSRGLVLVERRLLRNV
jgi:VanZ family protein